MCLVFFFWLGIISLNIITLVSWFHVERFSGYVCLVFFFWLGINFIIKNINYSKLQKVVLFVVLYICFWLGIISLNIITLVRWVHVERFGGYVCLVFFFWLGINFLIKISTAQNFKDIRFVILYFGFWLGIVF